MDKILSPRPWYFRYKYYNVMGKSTILDLNSAISEKDAARRNYIQSLSTYWSLYYGLRSMTGYDFSMNIPITWQLPKTI